MNIYIYFQILNEGIFQPVLIKFVIEMLLGMLNRDNIAGTMGLDEGI